MRPLLLALSLVACAESPPADPPAQPTPVAPAAKTEPSPEQHTRAHMKTHFMKAAEARDAVIRGDWAATKAPMEWMATHDAPEHAGPNWKPFMDKMQAAAREAAGATDPQSAAEGVAAVAAECGRCHTGLGAGPTFTFDPAPEETGEAKGHMKRHQWAADRLWEGLVGPDDKAWVEGAAALHTASMTVGPDAPDARKEMADKVHKIAARPSGSTPQRVATYGQVLASCASCHDAADAGPTKHGGSTTP